MATLVLNAGSSSLKYKLFDENETVLLEGLIEELVDYTLGFNEILLHVKRDLNDITSLKRVVHRVVHGGEYFSEPTLIDEDVIAKIDTLSALAPLHNPANLSGIKTAMLAIPQAKHIAVFDTAFHQSMPEYTYRYPLDEYYYKALHVRRYGFHGSSHHYIANQTAKIVNQNITDINIISFHIGNGVSACAIEKGRSIDTSMGMTPLEGLMMGTRSGSIDPAITLYLMRENAMTVDEVDTILNKKSGLKAVGGSSDMRTILERAPSDDRAKLALYMYIYRLKKQLGAYMSILCGVDAIVFTGGIGENSAYIREKVCENLNHLGIDVNIEANNENSTFFHAQNSRVALLRVETDEELQMVLSAKTIKA